VFEVFIARARNCREAQSSAIAPVSVHIRHQLWRKKLPRKPVGALHSIPRSRMSERKVLSSNHRFER